MNVGNQYADARLRGICHTNRKARGKIVCASETSNATSVELQVFASQSQNEVQSEYTEYNNFHELVRRCCFGDAVWQIFAEFVASLASLGPFAWLRLNEDDVRFTVIPEQGTQVWAWVPFLAENIESKLNSRRVLSIVRGIGTTSEYNTKIYRTLFLKPRLCNLLPTMSSI